MRVCVCVIELKKIYGFDSNVVPVHFSFIQNPKQSSILILFQSYVLELWLFKGVFFLHPDIHDFLIVMALVKNSILRWIRHVDQKEETGKSCVR